MCHQDDKAGGGKIAFRQTPKLFIDVLFKKMWEEALHGQLFKQVSASVSLALKQKQDHHHHLGNSAITRMPCSACCSFPYRGQRLVANVTALPSPQKCIALPQD